MKILLILIFIPIYISMMFIPYWTRKTDSFGVSIPEEVFQHPFLKKMRKQYAITIGTFSLLFTIFFLLQSPTPTDEKAWSIFFTIGVIVYLLYSFFTYLIFHGKMKKLKIDKKWQQEKSTALVVSTTFHTQKRTYSNAWFMISFGIALITMFITFRFYQQIPDQIPMQYNFSGEVTNWAKKSHRSVLIIPIMQIYLTLLFLFINIIIAKAKQQIDVNNPEQSMEKNIIFRRRWSLFMIVNGIAFVILFSVIQFSFIFSIHQTLLFILPIGLSFIMILWAIILSFTTGQGGSRLNIGRTKEGDTINRDEDKHWKLGQFYFNKNDPSIFLEKRFGVGWTINCAHPIAWIFILGIILLAVGIPLLLSK